jgi:type III secretory pathway component EscV
MMHMGFMFPGFPVFFLVFLISIVAAAIFFSVNGGRRRQKMRRHGSGESITTDRSSIQHRIMRLAQDRGGSLTVTDVVLATGVSIKQAEETLNGMVDGFRIKMEVTDSGIVHYEFEELRRDEGKSQQRLP